MPTYEVPHEVTPAIRMVAEIESSRDVCGPDVMAGWHFESDLPLGVMLNEPRFLAGRLDHDRGVAEILERSGSWVHWFVPHPDKGMVAWELVA